MPALRRLLVVSAAVIVTSSAMPQPSNATQRLEPPSQTESGQVLWSFRDTPLREVVNLFSQHSGIDIQLRGADGQTRISRQINATTWPEAVQQVLTGYNRIGFFNEHNQLKTIYVTGLNGNATTTGALQSNTAILYPQNHLQSDPTGHLQKPEKLRALPASSVLAIHLTSSTLFNLTPGETIDFNLPDGTIKVTYDHSVNHANGDQTWIGYLTENGIEYRVILTFGSESTIGRIITPENFYTIESADGSDWLVDYNASGLKSGSFENDSFYSNTQKKSLSGHQSLQNFENFPDIIKTMPAPIPVSAAETSISTQEVTLVSSNASTSATLIDVLALYTPGFASRRNVDTRLNFLVAASNQAYIDSEIAIQLRIVHSQQLDYTDSNSNSLALNAMSDGESPFEGVKSLREQYGADLVTLIRPFTYPAQVSCGTAWVLGANQRWLQGDNAYSVVSDGSSNGYYCSDYTLVHELSHNMGSVHDRDNTAFPGIYAYSYGYGKEGVFGTIMSYLHPAVGVFSNPDINCSGYICGVDETQSTGANNALSLNNVASTVAAFMPTKVAVVTKNNGTDINNVTETPDIIATPETLSGEDTALASGYDVNADGNADILWQNDRNLTLRLLNGGSIIETQSMIALNSGAEAMAMADFNGDAAPDLLIRNSSAGSIRFRFGEGFAKNPAITGVGSDWTIVATPDLDGDGTNDIVWQNQKNLIFLAWFIKDGQLSAYSRIYPHSPEWIITDFADFDLDGKDDLFWYDPGSGKSLITLMSGSHVLNKIHLPFLSTAWQPLSAEDYDGDGYPDLIWHNLANGKLRLWKMAAGKVQSDGNIAVQADRRWKMVGSADINSDGIADLIWRHRFGKNQVMYGDGFNEPAIEPMDWVNASATPILK